MEAGGGMQRVVMHLVPSVSVVLTFVNIGQHDTSETTKRTVAQWANGKREHPCQL
eukprot:m.67927 g.67927  ORF g.67927 m.67927 type:complete len:55 (-) comp9889_c0_seq1:67-231(-)